MAPVVQSTASKHLRETVGNLIKTKKWNQQNQQNHRDHHRHHYDRLTVMHSCLWLQIDLDWWKQTRQETAYYASLLQFFMQLQHISGVLIPQTKFLTNRIPHKDTPQTKRLLRAFVFLTWCR